MARGRRFRIPRSRKRSSYRLKARRSSRRPSRRRSSKGSGGSVLSKIVRSLTTPQTYKAVVAENYAGSQALRSVYGLALGGELILRRLAVFRPSGFLWNLEGDNATSPLHSYPADLKDMSSGDNYNLHIDKYIWDTRIQNRSNASMELKVYECLVRKDIARLDAGHGTTKFDPAVIFNADLDPQVSLSSAPNQTIGGSFDTKPAGVAHSYQHPGFTPYQSQAFTTGYKIVKTSKFDLSPNEIIQKKFYCRAKSFKGRWLASSASNEWQVNWSKLILFSWVGMPVDNGITSGKMSRAKCDLFVTSDVTIKYHFTPGNPTMARFRYGNQMNQDIDNYEFNPTSFVPVIPASDTIQTTTTDSAPPETPLPAYP
ncbi:capsid protein [Antarctic virus 3_III_KPSTAsw014Ch]|nr:capsid protein [Antarctic virus 3_III_KPSTAsw014Ch]